MKKLFMAVIGISLFVAGYQHTRRQNEYIMAQSALTTGNTYVDTPRPTPASVKSSMAFRFIKPS